jgi:hypothetical protein
MAANRSNEKLISTLSGAFVHAKEALLEPHEGIIIFDNRFAQSFRGSIYSYYISSSFKTLLLEKDRGISDLSPLTPTKNPSLYQPSYIDGLFSAVLLMKCNSQDR